MVSILDGDVAQMVADMLADADMPRPGTLRKLIDGGTDDFGNPITTTSDHAFTGWRESYSALFAAQSGIPTTDVRIVVVATSCDATPAQQDFLQVGGVWHRVRVIEGIDPAGATIACQCLLQDPS
jgi:hypothetical protein